MLGAALLAGTKAAGALGAKSAASSGIGAKLGALATGGLDVASKLGGIFSDFNSSSSESKISTPDGSKIGSVAGSIYNDSVKAAENVRKGLEIKNEISRMSNPVRFAKTQGSAERAYDEARFPGTNPWERIGSPGIQGAMGSAAISGSAAERSARVSTSPAHREQSRRDAAFKKNLKLLDAQTQDLVKSAALKAEQIGSEKWRAINAEMREFVASLPSNWTQFISYVGPQIREYFSKISTVESINEIIKLRGMAKQIYEILRSNPEQIKTKIYNFKHDE